MSEDQIKKIFAQLADHDSRISSLEKGSQVGKEPSPSKIQAPGDYSGATGGVRLLLDEGFFKTKKGLTEIRSTLADKGYHYSSQAVHEALKLPSKHGGTLVVLKEGKRRVYVERK